MNEDKPGLDTIAIALYNTGTIWVENCLVALSGIGEGDR